MAFYPQQQQHLLEGEEDHEGEKWKSGTEEGQGAEFSGTTPQSAKAFFSQLDWRGAGGGDTGYMAYQTDSDSDESSSSSEEEEEMFNHTGGGPNLGQPQLNHVVSFTHLYTLYNVYTCTG